MYIKVVDQVREEKLTQGDNDVLFNAFIHVINVLLIVCYINTLVVYVIKGILLMLKCMT